MHFFMSRNRWGNSIAMLAMFAMLTGWVGDASAAESSVVAPVAVKRFATVWRLSGEVLVTATAGGTEPGHKLRVGDTVYVGETVVSSPQGEVVLKTDDAGVVAVRPKTEFVATRYAAEDKATDGLVLRLLSGSLRLISGWVAHTNRGGSTVETPTATVGIRGTDHETFVLSSEMAQATGNKEGTYDKVNRGGTILKVEEGAIDIEPGKVGFARAIRKGNIKERGLLTLLLPVLLDRVPGFFVPGAFDSELDQYSQTADQEGQRQLAFKRSGAGTAPPECEATAIAKSWITQFDASIARKDANAVVALFAADATVRANVRTADGSMATLEMDRDDLAESSIAALKDLTKYQQRRLTIEGKPASGPSGAACTRIAVSSVAVEQGEQSGKPYRFESLERYQLDLRDGKWLATKAETTQK